MATKMELHRLITMKHMFGLELKGMKRRGRSIYSIVRREFGLRGTREAVFTQYCELVERKKGELVE